MGRVKISKKDLKEDELRHMGEEAYDYYKSHKRNILIIIAAIAIIYVGYKFYSIQKRNAMSKANDVFTMAMESFQKGIMADTPDERISNMENCEDNARRLVREFASTPLAQDARYLQGSAIFFKARSASELEEAVDVFNAYISKAQGDIQKAVGYNALGYTFENQYFLSEDMQKLDQAMEAYGRSIKLGGSKAPGAEAKISKARLLELQGKDNLAATLYESVKMERENKVPTIPQDVEFTKPQMAFMSQQLGTMQNMFTFSSEAEISLQQIEGR